MIRFFISVILLPFLTFSAFVCPNLGKTDGLAFKSHQVTKENRTSVYFPDQELVCFKDYLKVEFDYYFYPNPKGCFGNICDLSLGNAHHINFMLNVLYKEGMEVCVVDNHKVVLEQLVGLTNGYSKWYHVAFEFLPDESRIILSLDGKKVEWPIAADAPRKLDITFGANPLHPSNDVAAFVLGNLQISTSPDKVRYEWRFDEHGDGFCLDSFKNKKILVDHPFWMHDLHSKWMQEDSFKLPFSYMVKGSHDHIWIVASDSIYHYNLHERKMEAKVNRQPFNIRKTSGNFIYNTDKERIEYFNPTTERACHSFFSEEKEGWMSAIAADDLWSVQNNMMYVEGQYFHLFGYGHHRYSEKMFVAGSPDDVKCIRNGTRIAPRYLSATGLLDGQIYICSGVGNAYGSQVLGTEIFHDLYRMDLATCSIERIENICLPDAEVAAQNMFFQDSTSFLSLFFNPFRDCSYLILKQIFLDGSEPVSYCDTIPYRFHDMNSEARLYWTDGKLYAMTKHQTETNCYEYNLYSTLLPVLPLLPEIKSAVKSET